MSHIISRRSVPSTPVERPVVRIEDDVDHSRFDLFVDDELVGILGYRFGDGDVGDGRVVALMHTVVKEEYGDRGWAGVLVRASLNTARDRQWRIVPICTYVRRYLAQHEEFLDLIAE
ncbi:GNAT family N-acetyltransferase [Rhodococcus sp. IEGM 1381]|uniref:GNAT family N-acetyltransferase n=1 Tax=Rhodococcus sp. IEGM 1381 TaxID=3047085 RepID=UPI0024B6ED7F|nr:GNAT family N-acetyltransferase [Rhodococcus sp. IEGM 1381]MDI9897521.1 GNAT family N-acetyltransferase [Rhodococcus sp. IEGM 1381]